MLSLCSLGKESLLPYLSKKQNVSSLSCKLRQMTPCVALTNQIKCYPRVENCHQGEWPLYQQKAIKTYPKGEDKFELIIKGEDWGEIPLKKCLGIITREKGNDAK